MKYIRDHKTRELIKVELTPGEKQYLSSTNLRNVAPEAYAEVKANGAKRWLKNRARSIEALSKDDCMKGH